MEWISVMERLPEAFVRVLITDGERVREGYYRPTREMWFWADNDRAYNITHWADLPEPPEEAK